MEDLSYLKNFSIIHRFSTIYHMKQMKDFKISGHQMGYIMCVCKEPGVSQEMLSSYLKLNKGAVAKGVRPLIDEGYIDRVQNEQDRRAYQLYPTDKAKDLLCEAEKTMGSFDRLLTRGMTEAERNTFRVLLDKACDNVLDAAGDDCHGLAFPPSECKPPDNHKHHHQ